MKQRKWDPKIKAKIVLEGIENKVPLAELCNRYQISHGMYYRWLNEFRTRASQVFETMRKGKKEQDLITENRELKRVIAELSIELKKTEFELKEINQ
jgi:transposase-like protein